MGDRLGIHGAAGLFWPFWAKKNFLQTHATKFAIILDVMSIKKFWPPGGLEPAIFGLGDQRLIH